MTGPAEDQKETIREQLQRILSSTTFSGSDRHRRFLTFVVEQALKGDTEKLNEFVLGFEVFNKNESFDPRIDSIVRVEARRLRERLTKYYQDEGRDDPIIITLRPRSFVPQFAERNPPKTPKADARAWLPSHKTLAVALAALLCGVIGTVIFLTLRTKTPARPQTVSIIVLPFQTFAPASNQELGNGIADAIITGLAGTPGLRVISRGSAIQFNESGGSRFQLAAGLGVDYIVEGTVRAKDDRAAVSAKLTDVHTQSYVWAQTREGTISALADLERDLINGIVSRIRLPPPPDAGARVMRRRAATPQAYGAYLRGQYYWYQGDRGSLEKSIELFEEALRGDPNFAPAWAWLSQSYLLMVFQEDGRNAAVMAKGRQAATKALALDGESAEAHAAVASYAALDWNWDEAERNFRRAIELNPDWAQGHLMFSIMYLVPHAQFPEAMREVYRAHDLDPLTRITRSMLAEVLYFNRDYARALAESEDMHKASPRPVPGDRAYLLSLAQTGQGRRALAEIKPFVSSDGENVPSLALYGYLLAKNGDRPQAEAILKRLIERSKTTYIPALSIALVSVGLGNQDEAFRQLQGAVANHVPSVCQVVSDPAFEPLHKDPRFTDLVRQMGLQ